ncbi:MAG TPA: AI-2E family transporter [Pseudomonadota bacterium]|nr:AI-2E family transporter [Pseudomonadota bacterium]
MFDDRRLTLFLIRLVLYIGLVVLAWSVLSYLSLALAPVGVGIVVAFLLDPSVRALESRRVPRWLAVGGMVLVFLGFLTLIATTLPYLVSRELDHFAEQIPAYKKLLDNKLLPLLGKVLKTRAHNVNDYVRLLSDRIGEWARGAAGQISVAVGSALLSVAGFFKYLITVLLVPIFAVSFLMDMPSMKDALRPLVPPRHQQTVSDILQDIYVALGGWLRGQLTVMTIQAALYSIGLSITDIPLAIVIGCTAGFLAFVPYVGVSIGLLAALTVALLEASTNGLRPIIGVLVTFGAVQLLDAFIITPRAVGGRIGLSAVGVIFSLSLGGTLLGYIGLLLAVPLAAVLKALLPRVVDAYTATPFYQGGGAAATANSNAETPASGRSPPRRSGRSPTPSKE